MIKCVLIYATQVRKYFYFIFVHIALGLEFDIFRYKLTSFNVDV